MLILKTGKNGEIIDSFLVRCAKTESISVQD